MDRESRTNASTVILGEDESAWFVLKRNLKVALPKVGFSQFTVESNRAPSRRLSARSRLRDRRH
jgi:hypothetical protein